MPEISILVVNYKTPLLVSQCISSIKQFADSSYEIIVVDNNSGDDSKTIIKGSFPEVIWISNDCNDGFGRAVNIGVSKSNSPYILLINSDIRIYSKCFSLILEEMKNDLTIGILGCQLQNSNGTLQNSSYYHLADAKKILRDNLIYEKFFYQHPDQIKAVMGSFMLVKGELFEEIGGFDPDFFMYAEEIEFCNRIGNAGYQVRFLNAGKIIHYHGGSSKKEWALKQCLASEALLYLKVKGITGYFIFMSLSVLNLVTNFVAMWFLDSDYRKGFFRTQTLFLGNIFNFLKVPFLYKKKFGSGEKPFKIN